MSVTRASIATLSLSAAATAPAPPSSAGPMFGFVFRPGANPDGPNVFADWPTLMNAVGQVAGPKFIQFDTSFGAAHVTSGLWDLDGATITSAGTSGDLGTLNFDTGAQIEYGILSIINARIFINGTPAPIHKTGGVGGVLVLTNVNIAGNNILLQVDSSAGLTSVLAYNNVVIGDGIGPAFSIDGHVTLTMFGNCLLASHATGGSGTLTVGFDPTCNIGNSQLSGLTATRDGIADNLQYNVNSSANWNNSLPGNVANALNRIAAKIGPIP